MFIKLKRLGWKVVRKDERRARVGLGVGWGGESSNNTALMNTRPWLMTSEDEINTGAKWKNGRKRRVTHSLDFRVVRLGEILILGLSRRVDSLISDGERIQCLKQGCIRRSKRRFALFGFNIARWHSAGETFESLSIVDMSATHSRKIKTFRLSTSRNCLCPVTPQIIIQLLRNFNFTSITLVRSYLYIYSTIIQYNIILRVWS